MRQTRLTADSSFLDAKQCADIAGISARYVYKLCEKGEIKAVRIGNVWRINKTAFMEKMGL